MTEFKQIIGRGTRIKEEAGKTHFVVLDFRNVTRLFADPDWDGPIVIDPNYPPKGTDDNKTSTDPVVDVPTTPRYIPHVDKDGCKVEVLQKLCLYITLMVNFYLQRALLTTPRKMS